MLFFIWQSPHEAGLVATKNVHRCIITVRRLLAKSQASVMDATPVWTLALRQNMSRRV
jgi:hypothetical protein